MPPITSRRRFPRVHNPDPRDSYVDLLGGAEPDRRALRDLSDNGLSFVAWPGDTPVPGDRLLIRVTWGGESSELTFAVVHTEEEDGERVIGGRFTFDEREDEFFDANTEERAVITEAADVVLKSLLDEG